jgi:hypothetical protein
MPERMGRRVAERNTEQLDRDLDRPARVLEAVRLSKARSGPRTAMLSKRRMATFRRDLRTNTSNHWLGFAA